MIAVIDYGAGNLKSVQKALKFLGKESCITRDHKEILSADQVILPGVGAFGEAMQHLRHYELDKVIWVFNCCLQAVKRAVVWKDYISLREKLSEFQISLDLRFLILVGILCIYRIGADSLRGWKKEVLCILYIRIT